MPDHTTWDGLPIAAEEPHGAAVMVRRETHIGRQYLILHRAHHGPDYDGDWAWTPPTGARQPGESILAGALRELAEEADISTAEIWPVDLAGNWARFCVDVPVDMPVRLVDVEHDRFAWVSPQEALRRCTPDTVSGGIRRAERIDPCRIGFHPLSRVDLSLVLQWHSAPHAARWFADGPADLGAAEAKYGPRIDGVAPVRMDVIEIDGKPRGYAQHYPTRDHSDYATAARDPDAVAIDYLIGDPDCVGRGLGPRMLWQYVREVVLPAHPTAPRIIASPDARNTRSIRALEKAGFQRGHLAQAPGQNAPEQFCVLDRARVFGP
jgi:RimJ/RimL family protein N-acetyltransferase